MHEIDESSFDFFGKTMICQKKDNIHIESQHQFIKNKYTLQEFQNIFKKKPKFKLNLKCILNDIIWYISDFIPLLFSSLLQFWDLKLHNAQ